MTNTHSLVKVSREKLRKDPNRDWIGFGGWTMSGVVSPTNYEYCDLKFQNMIVWDAKWVYPSASISTQNYVFVCLLHRMAIFHTYKQANQLFLRDHKIREEPREREDPLYKYQTILGIEMYEETPHLVTNCETQIL